MDLLWEGLLTQLPSALITAAVAGVVTLPARIRARRRKPTAKEEH